MATGKADEIDHDFDDAFHDFDEAIFSRFSCLIGNWSDVHVRAVSPCQNSQKRFGRRF